MRRLALFVVGVGVGVVVGTVVIQPSAAQAQENKNTGLRLSVVGIAVKDYPKSQNFYEKVIGFPVAFKFSSADGKRTTTYYQMSRDTFLEMQSATADVPPGLTHVHIVTDDLNATIARLRQAGLPAAARNATTPNTLTEPGVAQPSNVKNANVFDPNGIRLELNELIPESLTKKATESWSAAQESKNTSLRLSVVGIAVKDSSESQNFYEKVMGFRVAFKFPSADGKRTTTYYQMSRDAFLEMQSATADVRPGLTHVHIVTDDLNATIARLRQAGLPAASGNATTPNTLGEVVNVSQGSHVKNANVFDPDGIRLELNEYIPESLTRKAAESWK
jgi:catechol 2,3-dioxygenase-like lactoylglutathione lyase family enzyme